MAVADKENSFIISGNGDVLEPEHGIIAIGSGGNYALAAARSNDKLRKNCRRNCKTIYRDCS